ncbi:hypothetical protein DFH11DRAFT_1549202 [Phellopilus nigrolimitatus]|nr:hypothetical protein DFH11DRAFT_1549202 [Phellopilus nigrolimitatus]
MYKVSKLSDRQKKCNKSDSVARGCLNAPSEVAETRVPSVDVVRLCSSSSSTTSSTPAVSQNNRSLWIATSPAGVVVTVRIELQSCTLAVLRAPSPISPARVTLRSFVNFWTSRCSSGRVLTTHALCEFSTASDSLAIVQNVPFEELCKVVKDALGDKVKKRPRWTRTHGQLLSRRECDQGICVHAPCGPWVEERKRAPSGPPDVRDEQLLRDNIHPPSPTPQKNIE